MAFRLLTLEDNELWLCRKRQSFTERTQSSWHLCCSFDGLRLKYRKPSAVIILLYLVVLAYSSLSAHRLTHDIDPSGSKTRKTFWTRAPVRNINLPRIPRLVDTPQHRRMSEKDCESSYS
jgi:hypothetical protein